MTTHVMALKARVNYVPKDYRPIDDEPFMCSRQRAYFRGKLLTWRDEILRSTKETRQHLHEETVQHPRPCRSSQLGDRTRGGTARP